MCVCVYIYIQTERETAILKLHGNCKPKVYNRYTHNKGGGIQTQHRRVIKSLSIKEEGRQKDPQKQNH